MFGSSILEVAIGTIFVFVLVSIICSAVREGIEAWLKTRAAYLEYGIRELLHDKSANGLADAFYNHPLIYCLFNGEYEPQGRADRPSILAVGRNLPSYIPAGNFASALMDIAARGPKTNTQTGDPNSEPISLNSIRKNILNLDNEAVQRVLLTAVDSADGDLAMAKANLEAWYDSAMDRVSGWYKRSTQWIIFAIAMAVAVGLNINALTIIDFLSTNEAARTVVVRQAESMSTGTAISYEGAREAMNSLSLPIGWTGGWGAPRKGNDFGSTGPWNYLIAPILGWLMTAFAATLGAPFWFDVLNKVMVIRSTVKPHEKSREEGSEDRQVAEVKADSETAAEPAPSADAAKPLLLDDPIPEWENYPSIADSENEVDGCDVIDGATSDEELPQAEGGIA